MVFISTYSYSVTATLSQIVENIKNCETIEEYQKAGYTINVDNKDNNSIVITTKNGDNTYTTEFKLEDGILVANLKNDDINGAMWSMETFSAVAQLYGYTDEYITGICASNEIQNYTIDKEGFEMTNQSDGTISVKININNINLTQDLSNIYITTDDLSGCQIFKDGYGNLQMTRGYVTLYLKIDDDNVVITVGENKNLTDNSYKSACSVLGKLFDSSIVDAFTSEYKNFLNGNKEWQDFKIEIDPEKTDMESVVFSSDKIVRITLDKSKVTKDTFSNSKESGSTDENNKKEEKNSDNTIASSKIPNAGKKLLIIVIEAIAIIFVIISFYKLRKYKI